MVQRRMRQRAAYAVRGGDYSIGGPSWRQAFGAEDAETFGIQTGMFCCKTPRSDQRVFLEQTLQCHSRRHSSLSPKPRLPSLRTAVSWGYWGLRVHGFFAVIHMRFSSLATAGCHGCGLGPSACGRLAVCDGRVLHPAGPWPISAGPPVWGTDGSIGSLARSDRTIWSRAINRSAPIR